MIKVISHSNLPPQFPGLFIFCCWLGYRFDPEWVVAYTVVGTVRLIWWFAGCHATQTINLFREP